MDRIIMQNELRDAFAEAFRKKSKADIKASRKEKIAPTPSFLGRMTALFGESAPASKMRSRITLKRAFVIAIAAAILFAFATVAAVGYFSHYGRDMNIEDTDGGNKIDFKLDEATLSKAPKSIEVVYYPEYIPSGYTLSVEEIDAGYARWRFKNSSGELIYYWQDLLDSTVVDVDTEHGETDLITHNGYEIYIQETKSSYLYIWNDGKYFLTIDVPKSLSRSEMLKMIDSITP